ncbi:MAG: AlbA family DNA-binding domain-containing protein [Promethearchaeota archaeon]
MRILNSLINDKKIYDILESGIINCKYCNRFCDNCLLIERTPEQLVKYQLLDRILLKYIYEKDSRAPNDNDSKISLIDEQQEYWKNIIANGENKFIEFKSSLRWDYYQQKPNEELSYVIAKTIVAFLNSEGGKLFIGVNDDGEILGIENDYKTFTKKPNKDGFLLKLDSIINNCIGKSFIQYIDANIVDIDNKPVCIIEISKSDKPVFFKRGNNEEFIIRGTAGIKKLTISEFEEYKKIHWSKLK